ncbi:MAG: IS6 family transposase [Sneathiella sp.]
MRLAVMMYVRFPMRNVEDILHERGINIWHETIRYWWNRFGPMFTVEIKKKRSASMRSSPQWKWHRNEVFIRIIGELHYLWGAVDHEGEVLEALVTKKRNRRTALKFLKKILKQYGNTKVIVTDKLRSYKATMKMIGNEGRQETRRWRNNRAENSHQPFRRRERAMIKFRNTKSLQKFVSIHASVHNHFNLDRHLITRQQFKIKRSTVLAEWRQLVA